MTYRIQFLEKASQNLARLDKTIARRIVRKLNWLAENTDDIEPDGLRRGLVGFAKLREGDYRVVYEILKSENTILVRFIGHRSDVYKRR